MNTILFIHRGLMKSLRVPNIPLFCDHEMVDLEAVEYWISRYGALYARKECEYKDLDIGFFQYLLEHGYLIYVEGEK